MADGVKLLPSGWTCPECGGIGFHGEWMNAGCEMCGDHWYHVCDHCGWDFDSHTQDYMRRKLENPERHSQ